MLLKKYRINKLKSKFDDRTVKIIGGWEFDPLEQWSNPDCTNFKLRDSISFELLTAINSSLVFRCLNVLGTNLNTTPCKHSTLAEYVSKED